MKKNLFLILAFLSVCIFRTSSVCGEYYGGYEYEIRGNGSVILSYSGSESDIYIPYAFGYYYVTEIADGAFEGNQKITSVTMPGTIEVIGNRSFADCRNLQNLVLPVGIRSIGDEAFLNCERITNITLNSLLESIGRYAFGGCKNLSYISISSGESIRWIGAGAFDDTAWFKNQDGSEVLLGQYILLKYRQNVSVPSLPWYIITIAEDAFSGNDKITNLILPNYITSLQEGSVSGMDSLVSVSGGYSIISVAEGAFRDLPKLSSVTFDNVKLYKENFLNCSKSPYGSLIKRVYDPDLEDPSDKYFLSDYNEELNGIEILHCNNDLDLFDGILIIPETIREFPVVLIGEGACQNRTDIKGIVLPDSLIGIESWAFAYDTLLDDVIFPDSLQWIKADAFNNCKISTHIPEFDGVDVDPRAFYYSGN